MLIKHRKVRAIFNSVIALALMLITLLATMGSASAASPPGILECPSSPPRKPVQARGPVGRSAPRLPRHQNLNRRPESREAQAFRNFAEGLDQIYQWRKMMNETQRQAHTLREWKRMVYEAEERERVRDEWLRSPDCTENDPRGVGPYPPTVPVVVPNS